MEWLTQNWSIVLSFLGVAVLWGELRGRVKALEEWRKGEEKRLEMEAKNVQIMLLDVREIKTVLKIISKEQGSNG